MPQQRGDAQTVDDVDDGQRYHVEHGRRLERHRRREDRHAAVAARVPVRAEVALHLRCQVHNQTNFSRWRTSYKRTTADADMELQQKAVLLRNSQGGNTNTHIKYRHARAHTGTHTHTLTHTYTHIHTHTYYTTHSITHTHAYRHMVQLYLDSGIPQPRA